MNRDGRSAAGPDVERIERDLSETRARLDATVDALRRRLAPGEVADRAVAYARESGAGAFGRNLAGRVSGRPGTIARSGRRHS